MAGVRRLSGKHCYPLVEGGVVAVAGPGEGPTSFSRVRKLLMPHGTPAETASLELPFIGFCSVSLSVSVGSLNAAPSLVRILHCHGQFPPPLQKITRTRVYKGCLSTSTKCAFSIQVDLRPEPLHTSRPGRTESTCVEHHGIISGRNPSPNILKISGAFTTASESLW